MISVMFARHIKLEMVGGATALTLYIFHRVSCLKLKLNMTGHFNSL